MKSRKQQEDETSHYLALLRALYIDVARAYPARIQTECRRDFQTLEKRLLSEGLSHMTITLAALGKAIDTALASDTPLQVPFFAKRKGSHLPKFMGWLLECIFGADGMALPPGDKACLALKHARQLLLCFYKLELPIDQRAVVRTMDAFKRTDLELDKPWVLDSSQRRAVKTARALIARVLCNADPRMIIPRHGPGAVATGEQPWDKKNFKRFYPELHACYDYSVHFYFNASHLCDEVGTNGLESLELQTEPPTAKVVLVPKDSRGPRLISMEPLELQWIQQGLKTVLVETLESHPLTRRHVNFADQEVNRRLAMESSKDGTKVTLDMKDASDRVSLQLVQTLFPENWVECMESCRSAATIGPDGDKIQMNKFAPMGSALCFPVEALTFWALTCACLMTNKSMTAKQACSRVWVYGDDIVQFREDYPECMQLLEAVGLMFNRSKCCTGAHFRESCGMDAYNGFQVTPIRVKRRWSSSLDTETYASWVDLTNRFRAQGYPTTADLLEKKIQSIRATPYTNREPAGVMFVEHDRDTRALNLKNGVRMRFNRRLHRMEARTTFVRSRERSSDTGWRELLAHTTRRGVISHRDLGSQTSQSEFEAPRVRHTTRLTARDVKTLDAQITQGMDAGVYSVPHRVISKWGWAQVA